MSNHPSLYASAELFVRDASGDYRAASGDEVLHRARRVLSHRVRRGTAFSSPLVDVRVLDHLVVGGDITVSFAERG